MSRAKPRKTKASGWRVRRRAHGPSDLQSAWQPKRQRFSKPKNAPGFGDVRSMLLDGKNLPGVIRAFAGDCSQGRAWQAAVQALLQRQPTRAMRREMLLHFLFWFDRPVLHGSQWRVIDSKGFVGHKNEMRPSIKRVVDPESGELLEQEGKPCLQHVPARAGGRAGGLAGRQKKSSRQCDRYRRALRGATRESAKPRSPKGRYLRQSGAGGLVQSCHPKFDDRGAVRPKREGAKYAYAQHWLLLPPSPEMLRRWGAKVAQEPLTARDRADATRATDALEELSGCLHGLRETRKRVVLEESDIPF